MRSLLLFFVLSLAFSEVSLAQKRFFSELEVRVDTSLYNSQESSVIVNGRPVLAFPVPRTDQVIDVFFYPPETGPLPEAELTLSKDFILLDSLELIDSAFYRARIQFVDLNRVGILPLTIRYRSPGGPARNQAFELFGYVPTRAILQSKDDEVFLGEEKVFDVATSNATNIRADGVWQTLNGVEYRLFMAGTQLKLSIATTEPGLKDIRIPIQTVRPVVLEGRLTSDLPPLPLHIVAKASRTAFLTLDKKEVTLDFDSPKGIEIQIDRSRLMQLRKTYRIETTAEPGGAFVGEIYTRSSLSNDKVLAWIRPYALHRASDGYLYIKDGDDLKFITNLNILPKTRIDRVMLRHQGGDFGGNLTVSPGEQVDVRIEGTGMERVAFSFEGAQNVIRDSALATENVSVYSLRVPVNISGRKMVILRGKEPTGFEMTVREFQTPREFDFISLNWGDGEQEVDKLTKPILYDKTIPELTLSVNRQKIDAGGKMYGKQYLMVEINIFNARKELIETRRIDNIVFCPGDNSPRAGFYDGSDCSPMSINLNQYMGRKTFDLPDWATLEVTIRHNPFKYSNPGYSQRVELIVQKHVTFDVDVSFPAGLYVVNLKDRQNTSGLSSFSGISIAVIPQFSFYRPGKINKLRPYRVGAGFIAFNALNFSNSVDEKSRDLGLVLLGSVFPTKTGSRFSFPLYGGMGYKFKADKLFFLIGPGIQVSF